MAQVRERTQRPANSLDIKSRRRLKKIFTAGDLLNLSESASDGRTHELVEGKLYEMPPPSPRHGEVTSNIDFLLQIHVRQYRLGRVLAGDPGFVLGRNPDTVRGDRTSLTSRTNGSLQMRSCLSATVISSRTSPWKWSLPRTLGLTCSRRWRRGWQPVFE